MAESDVQDAAQLRAAQMAITATMVQEILQLIAAILGTGDVSAGWPVLRRSLLNLVRVRRVDSANRAAAAYSAMRLAAGTSSPFEPSSPRVLTEERIAQALNSAGPAVMRKALNAGATPVQARERMATTLTGTATRLALEAGRDVIEASIRDDDEALGWARVGDGDPCSWCSMLISRGAVYKSAVTAGDGRFGGEKYHDHDGCQAVPIFDPESPILDRADELYADWKRVTAGHGGKDAINVWRRWWESREDPATP